MPDVSDDLNRLLEDDTFTFVYDDNGNLISKTDKATLDLTTYSYDAFDRLVRADLPGGVVATYAYDALGRRIEKTVGTPVTRYIYDGPDIVLEFDASTGSDVLVARFAHGLLIDQPLATEQGGQSYYYHANHQGSVIRVTDATGAFDEKSL